MCVLTSADTVSLPWSGFATFAALMAAAGKLETNVDISARDGDRLTLKNMTLSNAGGDVEPLTFSARTSCGLPPICSGAPPLTGLCQRHKRNYR